MSFFFPQQKAKKPKGLRPAPSKSKRPVSPKAIRDVATLRRLQCRVCPLADEGNRVEAQIPKKRTKLFILGEGPGAEEEKRGIPFVGKTGKFLRGLVPDNLIKYTAYGNTVLHRPPDNRTPIWNEIECCRNFVIAHIEQAKPDVILGLGLPALTWMLNTADMPGMRGRVFAVRVGNHSCWFVPTYHPSFILRQTEQGKDPLRGRMGMTFKLDLERAFKLAKKAPIAATSSPADAKKGILTYQGAPGDFEALCGHLKRATKAKVSALDYETNRNRCYEAGAKVLTASISYLTKNKETTFGFAWDHKQSKWTPEQRKTILKLFKKYIKAKVLKVAHNAAFEVEWTAFLLGVESIVHDTWRDTMAQAQLIDERKGDKKGDDSEKRTTYQSLGFLTKMYFGLDIKTLSKLKMSALDDEPLLDVLLYNGADARFTVRLFLIQRRILREYGLQNYFNQEVRLRQPTVGIMQFLGAPVDQKQVKKNSKLLAEDIKRVEEQIHNLKVVKKFVKDRGAFNPYSTQDVASIFGKDYLNRPEIWVKEKYSEESRLTVNAEVLNKIDHPLAKSIVATRMASKLKSTYVDGLILPDGKVIYPDNKLHTSFNTTFAQSGRTSSDGPNLQNFPKREKDEWREAFPERKGLWKLIRNQIIAPEGYVLVSVDYGQLEWCTGTMCTRDPVMIEITKTEYDVHAEWTRRIAEIYPRFVGGKKGLKDKVRFKEARGIIKNKFVFPTIFGATFSSVAGYLRVPLETAEELQGDFLDEFNGLATWQDEVMRFYYKHGYVETLQGRRRHYPMSRNEAINHPIQGSAAEIVCDAMDRLSMIAIETGNLNVHPILNIHDDLTFIMKKDKHLDDNIATVIQEMLYISYKWADIIPISVEMSMGDKWGNLEEIDKFWNHKDLAA